MRKENQQNAFTEIAIKQNLLLWQLSKSFLDVEKQIVDALKVKANQYE